MTERNGRANLTAVICLIAAGLCFMGAALMQHHAGREYDRLVADNRTNETTYQVVKDRFERAQTVHLAEYCQQVDFGPVERERAKIKQALESAQHGNPNRRLKLVSDAERAIGRVTRGLGQIDNYLKELDLAKTKMATAPPEALARLQTSLAHVDALVKRGYFERCFGESRQRLTESRQSQDKAAQQADHYLEAYRLYQLSEDQSNQAVQLADAVLQLQEDNRQLYQGLVARLQGINTKLADARAAAARLEAYPNYHSMMELVQNSQPVLSKVFANGLAEARYNNSMAVQYFDRAHAQLIEADRQLGTLERSCDHVFQQLETVEQAQREIPNEQTEARREIDNAESHIRSNSQNSQATARRKLAEAERSMAEGDAQVAIDPPIAVSQYRQARRQASDAYAAVDTSEDTDSSTWSSGSSGGSSFGGSSGGSSSGGSSFSGNSGGSFGGSSSGSHGSSSSGSHGGGF